MEQWRAELAGAIQHALDDSDDEVHEHFLAAIHQDSSEYDEEMRQRPKKGSCMGRAFVHKNRELWHEHLVRDYFSSTHIFDNVKFRRRFRMRRELFMRIVKFVTAFDSYFVQKRDGLGRLGLSSLQKCTTTIRMLAYGVAVDATDEYCRLGENNATEAMRRFVNAIRHCFESECLRLPTKSDIKKQLQINTQRGFPGIFASLDCMHWQWKNCPIAWQGQFQDKDKKRFVILEAIADQSLWIWHSFFGLPGGNNDINILDRSPIVRDMLSGDGRHLNFMVNGYVYPHYYLLMDGIYPPWACFVQTIHEAQEEKKNHFAKMQEGARKDVERAFGVLQARWEILRNLCR
jgi:hypothetical protein